MQFRLHFDTGCYWWDLNRTRTIYSRFALSKTILYICKYIGARASARKTERSSLREHDPACYRVGRTPSEPGCALGRTLTVRHIAQQSLYTLV